MITTLMAMAKISNEYRKYLTEVLPGEADALLDALEHTEPSVSVRINRHKGGEQCTMVAGGEPVRWCADGVYLDSRREFTLDPAMHQGRYYVQDASSMILWHIVRRLSEAVIAPGGRHLRYLDACAAPGGKTGAAMAALPDDALVVANEFDYRRAEILKENVIKWGKEAVAVSRGDTARFRSLPGWFDIVAADVPCSGEGMMRKDPKACEQWSPHLVDECATRQREIVENLWCALRPGGYFIYSTCTFNRRENEDVMRVLIEELGGELVNVPTEPDWGVIATESMLRFLPNRVRGEGLAIGVVRKPIDVADTAACELDGSTRVTASKRLKNASAKGRANSAGKGSAFSGGKGTAKGSGGAKGGQPDTAVCREWLRNGSDYRFTVQADEVRAVAEGYADEVSQLAATLDLIHCGVAVGTVKGRDIAPAQGLAMSYAINSEYFTHFEADLATALTYLRRDAPQGIEAKKGFVLLTHGGYPLGFVKHLGNRSNNLYPQEWRILKKI
jgi:16S rRNA C967 or C1407 C5-methylase (RsmB/RsmF family)/NOL1/NOP2/fmu family ribosome biogenesis protein